MGKIAINKDVGTLLMEDGLITEEQLRVAREQQREQEKSIGRILTDMGLITEQAKMTFLHKKLKFEIVDISDLEVPPHVLTKVSRSYAERHRAAPILEEDGQLVVAMEDPSDLRVLDEMRAQTAMDIHPVLAPLQDIEKVIQQFPTLSQEEVDAAYRKARPGLSFRLIHSILFFAVLLGPMLFLVFGAWKLEGFSSYLLRLGTAWDVTLYGLLSWVVWCIIVWNIDGALFEDS